MMTTALRNIRTTLSRFAVPLAFLLGMLATVTGFTALGPVTAVPPVQAAPSSGDMNYELNAPVNNRDTSYQVTKPVMEATN